MVDYILNMLKEIGLPGLFAAMFLEGLSIPFPGIAVVLAYGYILPVNYLNTAYIAMGMSAAYSLSSLVPYVLGGKLEWFFQKPSKGFQKARELFVRYGQWSVAVSRPFGLGNYISYAAGMSKMNLTRYLSLTFMGIYPWSYVMLLLGNYFNGSYSAFQAFYQNHSIYVYAAVSVMTGVALLYYLLKHIRKRTIKL
ncbi:MAG: VTT domain-containing protein [Bacillaceae bacterium]|nr:VTT domain-containing protein [Bacillaceae bacterium]